MNLIGNIVLIESVGDGFGESLNDGEYFVVNQTDKNLYAVPVDLLPVHRTIVHRFNLRDGKHNLVQLNDCLHCAEKLVEDHESYLTQRNPEFLRSSYENAERIGVQMRRALDTRKQQISDDFSRMLSALALGFLDYGDEVSTEIEDSYAYGM